MGPPSQSLYCVRQNFAPIPGLCCHPWLHRPATARSKYWPVRRWWGAFELGSTSIAPCIHRSTRAHIDAFSTAVPINAFSNAVRASLNFCCLRCGAVLWLDPVHLLMKSFIHLRSVGDSSWFIIILPIHMEQPSVSLDNGWRVVSTYLKKKPPKYERYSTARERRVLTCPAWPCQRIELSGWYPGTLQTKSVHSAGQKNPQENPSSFGQVKTKSKKTNENKDRKCGIQRLIC